MSSGIFGIALTNGKHYSYFFIVPFFFPLLIYKSRKYSGVYYYCYEAVKAIFEKAKGAGKPMSTAESMLSGAIAGCAVVLATHPIWTINVSSISKVWAKYSKKKIEAGF